MRKSEKCELDLRNHFIGAKGSVSSLKLGVHVSQHPPGMRMSPQVHEVEAVVGIKKADKFPAGIPAGPIDGRCDRH